MGLLSGDTLGPLAVALLIFLLLLDLMYRRSRWAARYPPGPTPLPVLGSHFPGKTTQYPEMKTIRRKMHFISLVF